MPPARRQAQAKARERQRTRRRLVVAAPEAEVGQCFVGACSVVQYRVLDLLSIPQLSLLAFALLAALAAWDALDARREDVLRS